MFKKLDEIKVLRDPVHGYIHIDYKVIWDCVACKEFQRLRYNGEIYSFKKDDQSRFL